MRGVPLVLVLLLLTTITVAAVPSEEHDLEGAIALGNGDLRLARGTDHFATDALHDDVAGFSYAGDVRYETTYFSFGPGLYIRVYIMAPLGAVDVPFTFDWVPHGKEAMVPIPDPAARPTNCTDEHCLV